MKYSLVKTEFEVSGSKKFKPADYINKLDKLIAPLLRNTEYDGSVGVLRDWRSGMHLRRLMEFNLFPPEKTLIGDYSSKQIELCKKCQPSSVLNMRWQYFFSIASVLSVAYATGLPTIEKVGTAITDDMIKTYNISPRRPQ